MSTLKHQILQHLVEHGELNIQPADRHFPKVNKDDLDAAAIELDQAGHGIYTRTLDRLFLNTSPKTKKAFEDGVYLEKSTVPAGAPKVDGVAPPVKVAQSKAPAKKADSKKKS